MDYLTLDGFLGYLKQPEIFAFIATVLIGLVKSYFTPKAVVHWGLGHQFTHIIKPDPAHTPAPPPLTVHTESVLVRNAGRATAKGIEFCFNYEPRQFQVWPSMSYTTETLADNRYIVRFDFLGPGDGFSIEMLQTVSEIPMLLYVRALEGRTKQVTMGPMRVFPNFINGAAFVLLILGFYQAIYLAITTVQFLAN